MKEFMNDDFLLENETAKKLYHTIAKQLPIIDYHCHIPAKDIAEDVRFTNITQLWLGADHYKWRFMRSCGIEERFITGDASDREKFEKWAWCLGRAIGNPLFHWSHLELQRYFDYHGILSEKTADEVWTLCNRKLTMPGMSARELMKSSQVTLICTTDDPVDSLIYHEQLAADSSFSIQVLPAFRPDAVIAIEKKDFADYIEALGKTCNTRIQDLNSLQNVLRDRISYFASHGCKIADHGLYSVMYQQCSLETANRIFKKRLSGAKLTSMEELEYQTTLMLFLGEEYQKHNWTMQLHYGCKRDNNTKMYRSIGANTGFDCISTDTPSAPLTDFLNALDDKDMLPRTILYSLNPADNQAIGSIIGCFQNADAVTKIQQGAAWWFNDNKLEIEKQLISFASLSNLFGFVGMLTDSRSFLSYTRHEYFRRILCNLVGTWVENGEYPNDSALLTELIQNLSYNNAISYFQLPIDKV